MATPVKAVPVTPSPVALSIEDRLAALEAEVKKLQPETPAMSIGNSSTDQHVGIIRQLGAYLMGVPIRIMSASGRALRSFWVWFW